MACVGPAFAVAAEATDTIRSKAADGLGEPLPETVENFVDNAGCVAPLASPGAAGEAVLKKSA